ELVRPVCRQCSQVRRGEFDRLLVVAPPEMCLREKVHGLNAKSQVPHAARDLQRAAGCSERLVQLAEQEMDVCHARAYLTSTTVVVQALGKDLGFAQALPHPLELTEQHQHRPQLETDLKALLQCRLALW